MRRRGAGVHANRRFSRTGRNHDVRKSRNMTSQRPYGMHSDALVLHCPGALRAASPDVSARWEQTQADFFADHTVAAKAADHPDLTVITYNTEVQPCLLERCMDHLGLHVAVLGSGVETWSWTHKVTL